MKKVLLTTLVIAAVVMVSGTANASLLGIQLGYPDIHFNNFGTINYDALNDEFKLSAHDLQLTLDPYSLPITLTNWGTFQTTMDMTLTVNEFGQLVGEGTFEEVVELGEVTIGNNTYVAGTTLLAGTVTAFGWQDYGIPGVHPDFDAFVPRESLSGALLDINGGIWPSDMDLGIVLDPDDTGNWAADWSADFEISKAKGDKSVIIPEPTSLLLLGSGLLGLAAFGKKKKRS